MNCKPGDIAVVVSGSTGEYAGWLVRILHASPLVRFNLPDGFPHAAAGPGEWVIECLMPSPFKVNVGDGYSRLTRFASARDMRLRPIRDNGGDDETLTWAGKPQKEAA